MRVRVAAIVVDETGRVLLVSTKRGRPGYLVPPGGGVEASEGLTEAVEREMREEAGIAILAGELLAYRELLMEHGLTLELYFSARLHAAGPPVDESTEGRALRWVARDELTRLPHYPEQLAVLVEQAQGGLGGALCLGRADLRPGADAADTGKRDTTGE